MIRDTILFELCRRMIKPPEQRTQSDEAYSAWRSEELEETWSHFGNETVKGKDVVDFGSGYGNLSFFLSQRGPRSIVGVELDPDLVVEAKRLQPQVPIPAEVSVRFIQGSVEGLPLEDNSADRIIAFDVVEHIMAPEPVFRDWARVLRPGGRVLIQWCPFRGPWGPHMEALVPIPWAHVVFGEKALFSTAARIYDDPGYVHRHWDYDDEGRLKPNKWRAWSTFSQQGFINQLSTDHFQRLAEQAGLVVERFEHIGFGGSASKRMIGGALVKIPGMAEYFSSYVVAELLKR